LWYGTTNSTNPYWLTKYHLNNDTRKRFLMNANIKYKIADWLDLEGRAGMDTYNTTLDVRTYSGSPLSANGTYSNGRNDFSEKNFILALHARQEQIGDSKWGVSGSLFGQIMQSKETGLSASTGELEVPNFFT